MELLSALGSNGSGQLGVGHDTDVSKPTPVSLPQGSLTKKIAKIVAGGNHTLLLFTDGELYAAGDNSNGRCLFRRDSDGEDISTSFKFRRATAVVDKARDCKYKLISATWEASACVTSYGKVMVCGTGNRGELGLGSDVPLTSEPREIPNFPPLGTEVVDLAASMSHTVAILSNGNVYGWGSGRKGQLSEPAAVHWSPHRLSGVSFHAARVVCGRDFTYVVGAPEKGQHMILGSDKWSILSNAPSSVPSWMDIGASWGSIYVLLSSRKILCWGRNDHQQLGPQNLAGILKMTVGSEHILALTDSGSVLAWGWGEHGNCGPVDKSTNFDVSLNELPVIGKVTSLGAGCATSWIVSAVEQTR